ncbi:MAG: sulfotransferase family protein [Gammaproteobacteria bacterium]
MKPKVFCIGFHKTGTTSLGRALMRLSYRVTGSFGTKDPDIASKVRELAFAKAEQYDAFQDNPWPVLYKELDQQFPGSKFILTRRPADAWIQSQVRDFARTETPMRRWIYGEDAGCPEGNEDTYIARYELHNREVLEYFKSRPDDLLVIDLPNEDGWTHLCAFLGVPVPAEPFPHANKASLSRAVKNTVKKWRRR